MRILIICNRVPFPLFDGGNLAVMSLLKGLKANGAEVHLLSMNTSRHFVIKEIVEKEFSFLNQVETVPIDNEIKISGAILSIFKNQSYHVSRFISNDFKEKLIAILQNHQFDIIQLEGLFLMPYYDTICQFSTAKIVYRQHNIEYKIWQRNAQESSNPLKKWYLGLLTKQLYKFEKIQLQKLKFILPISSIELEENILMGTKAEQLLLPFGLNENEFLVATDSNKSPQKIYHIGAMDWQANQDGVLWFLEKVWPIVHEKYPQLSFHFAGRNMPEKFKALSNASKQIYCAGEVPDAATFEMDKDILIVPIQAAAGIRIKVLKAMAHSKAIVTTSMGIKGIDATAGQEVLIADTAPAFAHNIIQLVESPRLFQHLKNQAFHWVKLHYQNKDLIQKLMAFYQKIK